MQTLLSVVWPKIGITFTYCYKSCWKEFLVSVKLFFIGCATALKLFHPTASGSLGKHPRWVFNTYTTIKLQQFYMYYLENINYFNLERKSYLDKVRKWILLKKKILSAPWNTIFYLLHIKYNRMPYRRACNASQKAGYTLLQSRIIENHYRNWLSCERII